MKLKPLSITLCLALLVVFFITPATQVAADSTYTDANSITYTFSGTAATVTGYSGSGGAVNIPGMFTLNGILYTVTGIGANVFYCKVEITSITIPHSVTSIGDTAFEFCNKLTSLTIPGSVQSIGINAFSGCSGLTSITISDGVKTIGGAAFESCWRLPSITIPNSVNSIGGSAFYACSSLTSITLPNGITNISEAEFNECTSLKSIVIPSQVTSIGQFAFWDCTELKSVTIPEGATIIDYGAFANCTNLTSITIPNSVTTIGGSAFFECASLQSITIPSHVTSIDEYTFYGCPLLNSITIPSLMTSIGQYAFYGSGLTFITIPSSVTEIDDYAFANCSGLKSAYFLGNQPALGMNVFSYTDPGFILYCYVSNASNWLGFTTYPMEIFCTLTLNLKDGSVPMGSQVVVDSSAHISAPADPVRSGYTFGGWYKDLACKNIFTFNTDKVTDDITLYAKWTPTTYTDSKPTKGGELTIDQGDGVTTKITGSNAADGTVVSVSSVDFGDTQPVGIGNLQLNGAEYFDVNVTPSNLGPDAVARISITNPVVTGNMTMQYWFNGIWNNAGNITVNIPKISGDIPVSALTGTPIVIGSNIAQTWYLDRIKSGNTYMEKTRGIQTGSVDINGATITWLSDQRAGTDVVFNSGNWTVYLNTNDLRGNYSVQIGELDGSVFIPFTSAQSNTASGTPLTVTFTTGGIVSAGHYLALQVTNNGTGSVITDSSSYLSAPTSNPSFPIPELSSGLLLGLGVAGLSVYMLFRRRKIA